jgi:thiosulfate reductase/polysulfide reductase chain A
MTTRVDNEEGVEEKKVICGPAPGCSGCGLLVRVKDGKIVSRRGNPQHPLNQGHVCAKRFPNQVRWLEHPDQLMHPLKRAGERGENKWQRISWDQALDEIADKLKQIKAQYGAESLAFSEGSDRSDTNAIRGRFQNLFGNPGNVGSNGVNCHCDRIALDFALGGAPMGALMCVRIPPEEMRNVGSFVFCGLNVSESEPVGWQKLVKRLREEPRPKVIVIDPRRTRIAEKADMWLQIRPGTDAALLLAWINVIIEDGLYDQAFVDEWTFGFDQLKQRASEYTPERVAEITWIPAEKIKESARMYAMHKPASMHIGLVVDQIGLNGLRVDHARACLQAITGNMITQIGERPTGPGPIIDGKIGIRDSMLQLEERCSPEQRKKQLGTDRFKLMGWPAYEITSKFYREVYGIPQCMTGHNFVSHQPTTWRAILTGKPYPIKAMITWANNVLVTAPNTKLVYKALKSSNLELYAASRSAGGDSPGYSSGAGYC